MDHCQYCFLVIVLHVWVCILCPVAFVVCLYLCPGAVIGSSVSIVRLVIQYIHVCTCMLVIVYVVGM